MSVLPFRALSGPGSNRSPRRARRGRRPIFRPWLVPLEQRIVLSVDYWTGASARSTGNDNWSNAGNWSLGAVPRASDTADFTSSQSQSGTAVVDTAMTIGALVSDSTWGGTLDVNNALAVNGNLTLASGAIGGTATLTASGTGSQWSAGSLAGTVTLANAGTLTISGSSTLSVSGTLTNTGTIVDAGTQTISCATGTTIDNEQGATFDFQADGTLSNANGATGTSFNNAGTVENSAGSGDSVISLPVNNTGTIAGDSGTLQLTGGGSGSGTDTINSAAGVVQLSGSFSGTLAGAGTGAGFVELCSTAQFSPAFTGSGTAGVALNFTGSVLQWNTNSLAGIVTNEGTLTISGNQSLGLSGALTNTGTIVDADTQTISCATGTTINNEQGATFDLQADGALLIGNGATGTAFNNAGTIEESAGSGNSVISLPVNNTGTIAGDSGTLQLTGGGSGSGTDTIDAAGGVVQLSGSFSGTLAGTATGPGFVELGSTAQFSPAFTGAGTAGVTLNFSGSVLQWNVNSVAGIVANEGTLTIAGNQSLNLSGTLTNTGTIAVTGTPTINAITGTTINNEPGATFDFQSAGTLQNSNGATGSSLNNAGILKRSAGSGVASISLPVENTGTIAGDSGTFQFSGGGSGSGSDTINATAGATVTLSGNFSGNFGGSGAGTVELSSNAQFSAGFTGAGASGAILDFTGGVLQWNVNSVAGIVTNTGTLTISGNQNLNLSGTFTNSGTVLDIDTNTITAAAGTTINNEPEAIFNFQADANLYHATDVTNTSFNNTGTLEKSAGTGTTDFQPTLGGSGTVIVNSGTLAIDSGSPEFDGSQVLVVAPSAHLSIGGDLAGSTQNADQFAPGGSVLFDGQGTAAVPQLLEAMSNDLGDVATAFQNNFVYGTLTLSNDTYVQLTDLSQNVAGDTGADAVYINSLVVGSGSTLDLHGLKLYARQTQVNGTIVGGTIARLAAGGSLTVNSPAPGYISASTQVDSWTFYGHTGQTVAVVVNTGSSGSLSPLVPSLGYAQVQVLDPSGHVVGSGTNSQAGADVTLSGITPAVTGTYMIEVQAPPAQSGSTGNYLVTEWDATTHDNALNFDETLSGQVSSPYLSDEWNFSGVAAEQVQFNLVNSSSSALEFDLTGPNGVTVFAGLTASSGFVTLPSAGAYTLKAHLASDHPGSYAFNLSVTPEANLTPGVSYQDALGGSGQAQVFTVSLANPAAVSIVVTDPNTGDQNEVFVSDGEAPTQDTFQFSSSGIAADQTVAFAAQPGTYDILVYNSLVTAPGSDYTIEVQAPPFAWTGFTPGNVASAQQATVYATGVFPLEYQSTNEYQIQFVSAGGTTYPSSAIYLGPTELSLGSSSSGNPNGTQTLSATIPANTLPAGRYAVRITDSLGNIQTMPSALNVTVGGTGVLKTSIYVPDPVGSHLPATVYLTYSNAGTAPMAAPLLVLTATVGGQQGAFLSLNPALAGLGYFTNTTPAGFSPSVQFLASGSVPGVLEPGESVTVPVYEAGFLDTEVSEFGTSPINYTVGALDPGNTQTIDWSSLKASVRPDTINPSAWNAIFPILTANLGSTWGQYLQTLDADAVYLANLGQPTTDLNQLLSFEIEKANAVYTAQTLVSVTPLSLPAPGLNLTFEQSFQQSIAGRYTEGILGFGWTNNWDASATTIPNGDVLIENDGTSQYFSLQPNGTFASPPGERGTTLSASGAAYQLVAPDGTTYQFNADGTLNFVADTHGNRITAGYGASKQLISLTDSNGEFIDLAYNAQGLLQTLADSTGQSESYSYNSNNELTSYTDAYGTTAYTYVAGQSAAQNNALSEIAYADGTDIFFGYDSQGRLIDTHLSGDAEDTTITYLNPGGYVTTDANGNRTTVYFNLDGATAEEIDPLGNVSRYDYDANLDLTAIIGPGGVTSTATYDANGNVTSTTDPLGLTTTFTFDANNNLTSYTDAKSNTTNYAYDSQDNLLSVTYANGTEQQAAYNPLGEATQFINADGQDIGATYNANGLIATESFADGTSYSYFYNARGDLVSATDTSGTTDFSYTNAANPDLLTEVVYPNGTFLKFSYDVIGRRTQSVDQSGFTTNYAYDADGQLTTLTDGSGNLIVQYNYDPAGNLIQKDNGNGTRTVITYDGDGDLLSITNYASANGPVNSFDDYRYDALGDVLADTNHDGRWQYAYDADGRLTGAVFTPNSSDPDGLTAQNIGYVYNAAGNRLSETINGVTTMYVTNNVNEYTSSTTNSATTNYQYDADGSLISQSDPGGTTNYLYNELDQLTAVNGPGLSTSYSYDAIGNRNSQTVNGVTTEFEIDPALGAPVASFGTGGALTAHFTYGLGLTSQVSASGTAAYYDFNNIGSTIGITGTNGTYVNQYSYLPFGQTTTIAAALANPFTFVGQAGVMNDGSGTFAMRARQLDPSTGQFVSNDPLGFAGGGPNVRTYAANDPVQLIDPTGLTTVVGGASGSRALGQCKADYQINKQQYRVPGLAATFYYPTNIYVRTEAALSATYNWTVKNPVRAGFQLGIGVIGGGLAILSGTAPLIAAGGVALAYFGVHGEDEFVAPSNDPLGGGCNCGSLPTPAPGKNPTPPAPPTSTTATSAVQGRDPNSMVGPAGYGTGNYVLDGSLLPYQIVFENDPTATGAAQRVDISDPLDPNLDWSTLQLSAVGFGSTYITIPAGLQHYDTTVNTIENGQTFEVQIGLNLNPATGVLSASFKSIDPSTGLPPASPLTGFLPPEDGSGRGTGFVSFTINPKEGLATGTQIRNVAGVSFDYSPSIDTDLVNDEDPNEGIDPNKQALITIDATPPSSTVAALPTTTTETSFTVSWSGSDGAGPGIASYDVYVSDGSGPYTLWQDDTTDTSAVFTGGVGHTFSFYSVATDNVGLDQPIPTMAQATTMVVGAPTSSVNALPPSTTNTGFTLSWSGTPGPGATSIASYTVYDSEDGGPFMPFLTNTTLTSTTFTGQPGHTYGFYSVATNNVGVAQPTPNAAQATITVANTPTPTPTPTQTVIVGEQPHFERKTNKKGKPTGKAVLSGFTLDFGVPLNAAGAANFQVDSVTTKKVKKKTVQILHPITKFTVSYVAASKAVEITFGASETFLTGGQLTVLSGLATASGGTLSGNAVFTIAKGGKSIVAS
jgi:RHS repeat-associated protein